MNRSDSRDPSGMPDLLHDSLPLLTETVSEPDIPVLSEMLQQQAEQQAAREAEIMASRAAQSPQASSHGLTLREIEHELNDAARLIMQEIIDEYMLQIENELHRRLEEHLALLLTGGRR